MFPWRLCPSCHLLGCAVPMACSHPGPWPTAPCLPASRSRKAVSVCSCRSAAPHRARLVKATSGPSLWWLSEQTKRVDIIDCKYAVSTLPRNANMKRKYFKKGQKLFPGWKCPTEVWCSLFVLYINLPFHLWEPWWILYPILNLAMMDSCQWSKWSTHRSYASFNLLEININPPTYQCSTVMGLV